MDNMFTENLSPKDRIIVALDVNTEDEVRKYVKMLHPYVGMFKIGFQLIHTVGGPQAVKIVHEEGGKVFYDCKLHDTTDTMQKSACDIAKMGVALFNLHASAGIPAMKAVMEVCEKSLVAGVTVLTSLKESDCAEIYNSSIEEKVLKFAHNLMNARVPCVICSPKESEMIKADEYLVHLLTVTPAIRPLWAVPNDQNPDRIMTPTRAIREAKADYLVIGRPILQPPEEVGEPVNAAIMILNEIGQAEYA
ncbi:MAG TPA: orotidine-5'-phosphate decarboxylase [Candidatus Paceibacterota bacterium]|nr:orotidine-5'-phosphate decarboxylase [Candidatus Paceibacterota bacterium]